MTFLVTGATGFIGTNIVEQLAGDGERVIALSNVAPNSAQRKMANTARGQISFVQGDVRDQKGLEEMMTREKVTRVIHAAVITSSAEREKSHGPLIVDVNLVGAASAATAAANSGVERFVLVGSAGAFSAHNLPDGQLVEESQPHSVDTLYGIGKSAAEVIVRRICGLNGLSHVTGRVATAFGPWEHDSGYRDTLSPIYQLMKIAQTGGQAVLSRNKQSNWHYGRDAAAALITLSRADKPQSLDYNLGPQWTWSLGDWCDRLAEAYPSFRYDFGGETNVELYGDKDGGVLSWQRFSAEFGPTAKYDIDSAFSDFQRWIASHGPA